MGRGWGRAEVVVLIAVEAVLRVGAGLLPGPALDDLGQEPGGTSPPTPGLLLDAPHSVGDEIEATPRQDPTLLGGASLGARVDRATPDLPVRPAHLLGDRRPRAPLHLTTGKCHPVVVHA